MAITAQEIVTAYGAYYLNSGQNEKHILTMLTQGRQLTNFCTPIATDSEIFRLANATFQSLVQPFQKTFTQKGGMEIKPNELRMYHIKVDDEFMPDELNATWLGFLRNLAELDRTKWPLVRWLIENYYKTRIDRDMELNEYYKGKYVAPTAGTAGPDGSAMNGLKTQLQTGVNAGTINSVNLGALTTSNIFDKVEEFTDHIEEVYQGIPMYVHMSNYWYKKYMQDKRAQGFYQRAAAGDIDAGIDFTPLNVAPLASMVGTSDIFCTPKENLLHLTPATLNKNKFDLEKAKRSVAVMTDWWEGVGFGIDQVVWTNIQPE